MQMPLPFPHGVPRAVLQVPKAFWLVEPVLVVFVVVLGGINTGGCIGGGGGPPQAVTRRDRDREERRVRMESSGCEVTGP